MGLLGAIASWIGATISGILTWKIVEIIFNGISSGNWLMVIAGGILCYIFGIFFAVATIGLAVLGFMLLGT